MEKFEGKTWGISIKSVVKICRRVYPHFVYPLYRHYIRKKHPILLGFICFIPAFLSSSWLKLKNNAVCMYVYIYTHYIPIKLNSPTYMGTSQDTSYVTYGSRPQATRSIFPMHALIHTLWYCMIHTRDPYTFVKKRLLLSAAGPMTRYGSGTLRKHFRSIVRITAELSIPDYSLTPFFNLRLISPYSSHYMTIISPLLMLKSSDLLGMWCLVKLDLNINNG
jgi:hypothetical protein